jgi:hypothetical protein
MKCKRCMYIDNIHKNYQQYMMAHVSCQITSPSQD